MSKAPEKKWIQEAVGVVGEARRRFREFAEWMSEQGYTDEEIYQLILIWADELAPKEE